MAENNGSAKAVIDIGRGGRIKPGSKYNHQDQMLIGFYQQPESTAKEIAAELFDWKYERYADAPKRASDLASDKLGYLVQLDNRKCRRSGKEAHIYKITQRGVDYLRKNRLIGGGSVMQAPVDSPVPVKKPSFSDLKKML